VQRKVSDRPYWVIDGIIFFELEKAIEYKRTR